MEMRRINWVDRYVGLTIMSIQKAMVFRVGFLGALAGQVVQAFVLFYLWRAVFQYSDRIGAYTQSEMFAYLFISQAISNIQGYFGTPENEISGKVRSGLVATELLRPLDFQQARFFESIGSGLLQGVFVFGLAGVLSFLVPNVWASASVASVSLALVSVVPSFLIMFSLSYIAGLLSFWTLSFWGLYHVKRAIVDFFAGAIIPLSLFPQWLDHVTLVLPFRSMVYVPTSIFLGKISGVEAVVQIGVQVMWALVLWVAGKALWRVAVKKVTVHGG